MLTAEARHSLERQKRIAGGESYWGNIRGVDRDQEDKVVVILSIPPTGKGLWSEQPTEPHSRFDSQVHNLICSRRHLEHALSFTQ